MLDSPMIFQSEQNQMLVDMRLNILGVSLDLNNPQHSRLMAWLRKLGIVHADPFSVAMTCILPKYVLGAYGAFAQRRSRSKHHTLREQELCRQRSSASRLEDNYSWNSCGNFISNTSTQAGQIVVRRSRIATLCSIGDMVLLFNK
eukprot:2493620-Amphidinium_carterae.1